jgi:hypothetical protein
MTFVITGNLPQRKNQSSQLSPVVQKPDRDGLSGANLKNVSPRSVWNTANFFNLNTLEIPAPAASTP